MPEASWAIIVHGGAKTIKSALHQRNRDGCLAAAEAGAALLRQGGSALAAAEAAVRVLEDNPLFNAGFGSVLNADGEVEMDAAIMSGADLALGAVAGVRRIRNPVSLAAALLPERPAFLGAEGAERFASSRGIDFCDPREMIASDRLASEYAKAHDTVGCVALDLHGHVAAATSTGGLPGKHPGRIGDSPVPGCGLYADDRLGGVAFSGDGESILRTMLAAHVMQALATCPADIAAEMALSQIGRVGGEAGAIVIDAGGRFGIAHNSDHFAIALHRSGWSEGTGAIHRNEVETLLDE
ncbi:isoaspartyl peptidase/L-asparaginase family protein [Sphingobium indicum]|uniref:Isoaspartyl peptidase n=1 Tax=Sphingobium indicum F2 TaxID=1450518 RepID=A0A8E0WV11_9SPHN|nr:MULTISPECIES: isoaspartyl peptidase/L-asparaginase [Sphingobium]EQB06486.1 asparaginase [Sphingobium sp. HDIP04]KER37695.1 asparaginase [Sphingobium indicum F2]